MKTFNPRNPHEIDYHSPPLAEVAEMAEPEPTSAKSASSATRRDSPQRGHRPLSEAQRHRCNDAVRDALDVFSDHSGLLVASGVLNADIWLVRDRVSGERLAHQTRTPAIVVDDLCKAVGKDKVETQRALLSLVIPGAKQ